MIRALAWSPDGQTLASSGDDGVIRLWDRATMRQRAMFGAHGGAVHGLAYLPDGETLASAGGDGLVRLWPWRQILNRPVPKTK